MRFHVIDMPIEPIETRYSLQWARWFPRAYGKADLMFSQIQGARAWAQKVGSSNFLDPVDTFRWKFPQLNLALSAMQMTMNEHNSNKPDGFVVFLHDAWFPGIECFKYISDMLDIPIGIVGFWHAGSYIPEDPLGQHELHRWARGSECTWFEICDAVCVGSQHHKEMILSALSSSAHDGDKVHVTGYPCEVPELGGWAWKNRADRVVWPHRLSAEKHPQVFDLLAENSRFKGVEFVKTLKVCKTKAAYYEMLASSKVAISTAALETFGISMVEAALSGCYPICPNRLAYKETMQPSMLFDSYSEAMDMIDIALNQKVTYQYNRVHQFSPETVCGRICEIIKSVGALL